MGKIIRNLTIFSLVLLLFPALVVLRYREEDEYRLLRCRPAGPEKVMTGADAPDRPHCTLLPGESLNINTASGEALLALPGIDRVLAERIVEHRESCGPYEEIEDIMDVNGIGEGRFEEMKDYIRTGDIG